MRVAILHNAVPDGATLEDQDLLVQVDAVASALHRLGHDSTAVSCSLDLAAMRDELRRLNPDVVFNLVESLGEADSLVYLPHAVLDVLGMPYAGNRTESLILTTHKLLAKQWLRQAALPTPPWIEEVFHEGHEAHEEVGIGDHEGKKEGEIGYQKKDGLSRDDLIELATDVTALTQNSATAAASSKSTETALSADSGCHPPLSDSLPSSCPSCSSWITDRASWIIKGVWEQASRGMDDDAVMHGAEVAAVRARLRDRARRTGRPCFAEQFIEGREFNLSVVTSPSGPRVLPPAEIDFSAFPDGKPRIVGHRAKWQADSFEYNNTPRRFDFQTADRPLLASLQSLARRCWGLFRLRGWARVDFRVDAAGRPWILEVNANPCLSPDAGFAAALQQAGIPFDEAIRDILDEAIPPIAPTGAR